MNQYIGYVKEKKTPFSDEIQACHFKIDPALKLHCFNRQFTDQSEMRDMTLNSKRDVGVSYRGKLCIWKKEDCLVRLLQQCFHNKGVNVKIAIAHPQKETWSNSWMIRDNQWALAQV